MPVYQLLYAYESLGPLIGLIQHWSSAKATFRGKSVGVYRFIFLVWLVVRQCAEEHNNTSDERHCWYGIDSPGWGCKHLNRIFRDPQGPGNYKTSNRYWYNFGKFNKKGEWIINKPLIIERLEKEAREKALDTCPFFEEEKIRKAVQDLPDEIIPDGISYRIHYIEDYKNGEVIKKPVNIRHVHIYTDKSRSGRSIYDIVIDNPNNFSMN